MAKNSKRPADRQQSQNKRGRGRPRGSTDHPEDQRLLTSAARLLTTRQAKSATAAFTIVANGDGSTIRRLHRKWKKSANEYLGRDRLLWVSRWEHEFEHLRKSLPTLYARVVRFTASKRGKACLAELADDLGAPAHPMSLGLELLFKIMEEEERNVGKKPSPRLYPKEPVENPTTAERRFDKAITGWVDGGFEVTSKSLRELAKKCTELADAIDTNSEVLNAGDAQ